MRNLESQRTTFGTSLTLAGSVACCESHGILHTAPHGAFFAGHSVSARALPVSGHYCCSRSTHLGPYSKKIIFSATKPEFSKSSDLYLFLVGMELYCTLSHTHTLHLYNYNMYTDVTNSLKILVQVKCWLCYIKRLNWWLQINGSMDQWIYVETTNPYF